MKVYSNINDFVNEGGRIREGGAVVALGNFDGVHVGHAAVIRTAVERARECGLTPVCYTFSNHPRNTGLDIANGDEPVVKLITNEEEKLEIIANLGMEICLSVPFDERVKNTPAEEFISDTLIKGLNARVLCCGFNYRFGAGAKGDVELVRKIADKLGEGESARRLSVEPVADVNINGELVSSSRIRELIQRGEMEECASCLGRPYSLAGTVSPGNQIGHNLGFPTANFVAGKIMELPPNGVYYSKIRIIGEAERGVKADIEDVKADNKSTCNHYWYSSITNVGVKPTVEGSGKSLEKSVETHILDFEDDLYGQSVKLELLHFARPEQRFDSLDELRDQIEADIGGAKAFFLAH